MSIAAAGARARTHARTYTLTLTLTAGWGGAALWLTSTGVHRNAAAAPLGRRFSAPRRCLSAHVEILAHLFLVGLCCSLFALALPAQVDFLSRHTMARSKSKQPTNGVKREFADGDARPAKKTKLLDDSDGDSESEAGGVSLNINEDYARRFEHNKKREEQHRRTFLRTIATCSPTC